MQPRGAFFSRDLPEDKTLSIKVVKNVFYLRDLPSDKVLRDFAKRYVEMDISSVNACLRLLRSGSDLEGAFNTMLARHGLSQGRFLVLVYLCRNPEEEISPSQLSEKVGVTRATMTGLLDGLEREKLVERADHANDRRKRRVQLTKAGRKVIDDMLPDYYCRIKGVMKELSEEEREALVNLLSKVNRCLSAMIDD